MKNEKIIEEIKTLTKERNRIGNISYDLAQRGYTSQEVNKGIDLAIQENVCILRGDFLYSPDTTYPHN